MSQHDRSQHNSPPDGEPPTERSVDEVAELHHGEWILLQITKRDQHHQPSRGIVVHTGPTRRSIQPTVLAKLEEGKDTGTAYYVFKGYKRVRWGQGWADALDELVRQGTERDHRRR